jgi:hypothetical protein
MYIKSPTIQLFFQAIGRLNRWGGMGLSRVYIILEKSKADSTFIGSEVENNLQRMFIDSLRDKFSNKQVSLDTLYVFYNEFLKENIDLFKQYSRDKNEVSKRLLKEIYPRKKKESKDTKKIANANKLRKTASADEIFILVKKNHSNENITMACSIDNHVGTTKLFGEDESTYKKQIKILKSFENYQKYKAITPEIIRKEAIYEDSPYPVFNHLYDSEIGLFKID